MKPQTELVLKALQSGQRLTQKEAQSRFGVKALAARVSELRSEGYAIYTNRTAKGTSYRLGRPSREMVALAYAVEGNRIFS
jgi:hypothetical protein